MYTYRYTNASSLFTKVVFFFYRKALAHVVEEKGPLTEIVTTNVVPKETIEEEGEVRSINLRISIFGILKP